ncbi:hypothetical protein [Fundidesulfovibrio agrisoli]|uniref:hypothetical protein n=1 Tax=Fundidesulfovibrio agrisoli TaxID=2922717 RepID=UPI001FAC330D|nr:hypothetical protein [Fundidesulfovibrio agrisoli]
MTGRRAAFWTVFTLAGMWLQSFLPGVDFLAPGLILSLQEEKLRTTVILGVIWLFIQEGTGSLAFGTVVLWYALLVGLFFFGHWLFEARNFLFMMILGACLGVLHFGLMDVMTQLQDWRAAPGRVLVESIVQAVVFPVEWGLIYIIHNHLPQNGQNI